MHIFSLPTNPSTCRPSSTYKMFAKMHILSLLKTPATWKSFAKMHTKKRTCPGISVHMIILLKYSVCWRKQYKIWPGYGWPWCNLPLGHRGDTFHILAHFYFHTTTDLRVLHDCPSHVPFSWFYILRIIACYLAQIETKLVSSVFAPSIQT